MKRKVSGLIAALVLATIGTVAMVAYVQSAKNKAVAGELLVDVLVVNEPIAKGTAASAIEGVKLIQVPAKVRAEGAVADLGEVPAGLVTGTDLVPGEQVLMGRFITAEAASRRTDVPPGLMEVTLALEPERAVGGQVRSGDTVAVVTSFDPFGERGEDGNVTPNTSKLILHKILVTAVQLEEKPGGATGGDDGDGDGERGSRPRLAPTGNLLVTLALDAASVERVVFAAEHGRVWLSTEPRDAPEGGTRLVTPANVL